MTSQKMTILEVAGAVIDSQTVINEPMHFVIQHGRIVSYATGIYSGSSDNLNVVRKQNAIAMPGLINTHGHAAMTLLRGAGDDLPLMTWLNERIFPLEDKLTDDAIYWGTMLACWEMLRSGTTTYTDMYMMMDNAARAVDESGMRAVLSVGMVGFDELSRENGIERSKTFVQNYHNTASGRITTTLGPHAPYTCPPDYLVKVAELSHMLNVPIQIHLSETQTEVENAMQQYGVSPIELVANTGLLNQPVLASHCVHLSDADLELLARHNVHVAHNPQSNLKLGSGIAPLHKMLAHNLTVGLGTDGAASNNNLDMFEEMRLAATLHKGVLMDAEVIPASLAFDLATASGAKAVFFGEGEGTLRVGARCDMTLLDKHSPHLQPNYELISDVVYACGADDVTDVLIDGDFVLSNKEPVYIDTERVRYEVERIRETFRS